MIKFYEHRKWYFLISFSLIVITVIAIFVNGISLDIQFKGGSILRYTFTGTELDKDKAADIASNVLGRNVSAQETTELATGNKKLVFNIAGDRGLSAEEQAKLDDALKAEFKNSNLTLTESANVEPFIGKRFLQNGIIAIVLASLMMIIYIWFSFRKISGLSAGVMSMIALLHDVFTVFATFVIFKIPLNDSFIAVALTILGYSINDTIVIYDRIRENVALYGKKMPLHDLVNMSITQSLTRSINTGLCTFFSMVVVSALALAYNIESIITFALPMTVGIISGCYSTICIAGPLWVMWKERKSKKAAPAA